MKTTIDIVWARCALCIAVLVACRAPLADAPRRHVTEFRGGLWFDGTRFDARTMWVVDDRFESGQPAHVDEIVELHGGFVVPPYGEGHNHWLEPELVDAYVQTHLRDGIFYVKDQGTAPSFHEQMRAALDRPDSVDLISAHQGFTGPGGHPIELVDQLAAFGVLPKAWATTHGEGEALFAVASDADVARAWPRLIAGHPDFAKVFLVHSDEYAARRDDAELGPQSRGIEPALVHGIVSRAHAAHLRVSAHIENAADFHAAIVAGVDDIAHMPFIAAEQRESYRLADADVAAAGARHVTIATTLDWLAGAQPDDPRIEIVLDNIARLRRAGVAIVIGTDLFRTTARAEVDLIASFHLMSNIELLRAWCEDTPRAIFPGRRIGRLEAGAEASFLVLRGDPLADFAHSHDIEMRMKQGRFVVPTAVELPVFPPKQ